MAQTARPQKIKVAIIGSGNIGTDLMIKVVRTSSVLEMGALAGIDPDSDGLAQASRLGIATTAEGIMGLPSYQYGQISKSYSMPQAPLRTRLIVKSA